MAGATTGSVTVDIDAPALEIYNLLADVTRMGEWSPECRRCEWADGAMEATVGARFIGHNQMRGFRWSMTCEVTAAAPGAEFAFKTLSRGRDSTRWRFTLDDRGGRTSVTESYEFIWAPLRFRIADRLMNRDQMLRRGMERTLARLKTSAEGGRPAS